MSCCIEDWLVLTEGFLFRVRTKKQDYITTTASTGTRDQRNSAFLAITKRIVTGRWQRPDDLVDKAFFFFFFLIPDKTDMVGTGGSLVRSALPL